MSTIARNAKAIFLEAVENHQPEQWSAFLDEKCGEDRELRQRVESLLQAHQDRDDLFDRADPTVEFRPLEKPGTQIGPYTVNPECSVISREFSSGKCEWRVASGEWREEMSM